MLTGEQDSLKEDASIQEEQMKVASEPKNQTKKVRHIYLEEENIYGRFIPYLLLKD